MVETSHMTWNTIHRAVKMPSRPTAQANTKAPVAYKVARRFSSTKKRERPPQFDMKHIL